MVNRVTYLLLIFSVIISSCNQGSEESLFMEIEKQDSNITFSNQLHPNADLNILTYLYYYNGAGVAVSDYNNDGLNDIYFVGNQVQDALYKNEGNFTFTNVTASAKIDNAEGWTTGVTNVDINADGWMDIYLCKVGNYKGIISGRNKLYVNQGLNAQGQVTFKESAAEYGLDISSFATHAAFLDYDLDGDLDMYLLNHSVHPNRSYGKGAKRKKVDLNSGDRFYENVNGTYKDVTAQVGLNQGAIGYGLGLSVGDMNEDGYPDIYVGNDFFENDYLYINQSGKGFEERINTKDNPLGHTTHYSMGNNIADINNDTKPDIVSLDMLPEELSTLKVSGTEYAFPIYREYLKNGYAPQFMQNTLHLNKGGYFQEVAYQSNISATDWSWGVLISDLDLDGWKDLYISNGIVGATNDMDFIAFIAQEKIQKAILSGSSDEILAFAGKIPERPVENYAYKGSKELFFQDVSDSWFQHESTYSAGAVSADLDNDGDLDIVVNNTNGNPSLFRNGLNLDSVNFLKIRFEGSRYNPFGIGAKVLAYADHISWLETNDVQSSYLSSGPAEVMLGLGQNQKLDSLVVVWPDQKYQVLKDVSANQTITLRYEQSDNNYRTDEKKQTRTLKQENVGVSFEHNEEPTLEFNRDPLVPFGKGNEGPKVAVGDVNSDGLEDLYFGGAKWQAGELFIQKTTGYFTKSDQKVFDQQKKKEETDNLFFDADGDGDLDLWISTGGNDFKRGEPLQPRLLINEQGKFVESHQDFSGIEVNTGALDTIDIDSDDDLDIVIGANTVPGEFGVSARNFILRNDNGTFTSVDAEGYKEFLNYGLIEDFFIQDIDNNGYQDIIAVGHWNAPTIFYNDGTQLRKESLGNDPGWWNTIEGSDFDNDGDIDFVVGNWGLNTRLKASNEWPVTLYRHDFDNNGKVDPILTYHYKGVETVLASKDELTKQIPTLNKDFLSYQKFADASLSELFGESALEASMKEEITELRSCYFENKGNGHFKKHPLPNSAMVSSVHAIFIHDFNQDQYDDLLIMGNSYEISTQIGRLDALRGTILINDQQGSFQESPRIICNVNGAVRDIESITIKGVPYIVVTLNNEKPVFLRLD